MQSWLPSRKHVPAFAENHYVNKFEQVPWFFLFTWTVFNSVSVIITLRHHYTKLTKIMVKCILDQCINGYIFQFWLLLLCCAAILLEKYLVQKMTMPSSSVFKQNFLNTSVFTNNHILIIHNLSGYGCINFCSICELFVRCLAYNMKWISVPNFFISEKYTYFCDILIKIKLYVQNAEPKFKSIWM